GAPRPGRADGRVVQEEDDVEVALAGACERGGEEGVEIVRVAGGAEEEPVADRFPQPRETRNGEDAARRRGDGGEDAERPAEANGHGAGHRRVVPQAEERPLSRPDVVRPPTRERAPQRAESVSVELADEIVLGEPVPEEPGGAVPVLERSRFRWWL